MGTHEFVEPGDMIYGLRQGLLADAGQPQTSEIPGQRYIFVPPEQKRWNEVYQYEIT